MQMQYMTPLLIIIVGEQTIIGVISYIAITWSGLLEILYVRGACLHEVKPSGYNMHHERTTQ